MKKWYKFAHAITGVLCLDEGHPDVDPHHHLSGGWVYCQDGCQINEVVYRKDLRLLQRTIIYVTRVGPVCVGLCLTCDWHCVRFTRKAVFKAAEKHRAEAFEWTKEVLQ